MLRAGGGTEAPLGFALATLANTPTTGFGGTGVLMAAPARVALALAGGRADSTRLTETELRGSLRSALLDEVAMIPRGKSGSSRHADSVGRVEMQAQSGCASAA